MDEPTFDRDGYPTEETTEAVRNWPITTSADAIACMDFVGRAWKYPEYWDKQEDWYDDEGYDRGPVTRYRFSTGGWSGNEDLHLALERNLILQMLGWWSSRRGGHHEYRFAESRPYPLDAPNLLAALQGGS
jgi:hypothetical protein